MSFETFGLQTGDLQPISNGGVGKGTIHEHLLATHNRPDWFVNRLTCLIVRVTCGLEEQVVIFGFGQKLYQICPFHALA
jgi:hypothetical protein